MSEGFAREKARVLARVDLSRKGSVDAAILPLLSYVNARDCYYSTSSCAGRMVLFAEGREQMKKGCHWLLVSHDPLEPGQLGEVLKPETLREEEGYIYFKFEPFVLHVMCATLSDARLMLQAAIASGFRNSGLSCGKKERWMVAVRSTHSLEVPLANNSTLLVSSEYLRHVVDIGNGKLDENLGRIQRFEKQLRSAIDSGHTTPPEKEAKPARKREKEKEPQPHLTEDATDSVATLF